MIEREKYVISNFIMQNDDLPKTVTQTAYPYSDNSTAIELAVYESISDKAILPDLDLATEITSFELKTDKPISRNTRIVINMTFDNAGLLTIDAEEMDHNTKLHATFNVKNSLNDGELRLALARSEKSKVE